MLFRFIGKYTNGRTAINACGVDFEGHEPSAVSDPEGVRRLSGNPEFEAVGDAPAVVQKPKRGRPRKVS